MIEKDEIKHDVNQVAVINWLDDYAHKLEALHEDLGKYKKMYTTMNKGGSSISEKEISKLQSQFKNLSATKSIYLWGDPGCGKSFMMEQFYKNLNIDKKNFLHYQEFMLQIHQKEHKIN